MQHHSSLVGGWGLDYRVGEEVGSRGVQAHEMDDCRKYCRGILVLASEGRRGSLIIKNTGGRYPTLVIFFFFHISEPPSVHPPLCSVCCVKKKNEEKNVSKPNQLR